MPWAAQSASWSPSSAMAPSFTTAILSAFMTVDSRCATSTTVESPFRISASNDFCTAACESSSSADVASSSRMIFGRRRKMREMATRCRWPPLSRPPRSPTRVR
mmetsp:Transcript_7933/g.23630  ORF Transcript_7933/g.23630 Transcript_7933/m.23630 type:complete len:104 (-) Transcript_7933:1386-1697(-)